MAEKKRERMRQHQLKTGGLVLAGVAAAVAMPKLLKAARRGARAIGGSTYRTSSATSSRRPSVDPASGRAA